MARLWDRWLGYTFAPVDTRVLALVRIGVAVCVVLDLLRVVQLGLVDALFVPFEQGGIGGVDESPFVLDELVGATVAGPLAMWVTIGCMVCVALGVGVRPALVVGLLAYSQLGHGFPPGDRGIDRILRLVMLFLLFSDSHRRYALGGGERKNTTTAWTQETLAFLLALIYLSAGLAKVAATPQWFLFSGTPVLYRVMADPLAGHIDAVFWADYFLLFHVAEAIAVVTELAAFVLLWPRARPYWASIGIFVHIGIALTMKLGMFSFGMMSLYPVLFAPWLLPLLDRLEERWATLRASQTSATDSRAP